MPDIAAICLHSRLLSVLAGKRYDVHLRKMHVDSYSYVPTFKVGHASKVEWSIQNRHT